MKNRSMLGVIAAVLLALVGGLLLWQNSDDPESEAVEQPVEETQVVVAKRDINAGESASAISDNAFAFVELVSVPLDQVELGALTSVDDLADLAIGRNVLAATVPQGAQVSVDDFVVPGQQDLSALPDVDPNLFEVTVALESQRALGGNRITGCNGWCSIVWGLISAARRSRGCASAPTTSGCACAWRRHGGPIVAKPVSFSAAKVLIR